MRICYVLLSPTFGMHQYTADLANRLAQAGHDVQLVTTSWAPQDRYTSSVTLHTPIDETGTGLSVTSLRPRGLHRVRDMILDLNPDLVHFTGPHVWNLALMRKLKVQGLPLIHTFHDLDSPGRSGYGALLHLWTRGIIRSADHLLVHRQAYWRRLLEMGVPREGVTSTPLLHLFVGGSWLGDFPDLAASVEYQPWALFLGHRRQYEGIAYLITASAMMNGDSSFPGRVVIAGCGDISGLWAGPLPSRVELHSYPLRDEDALNLFCRCGLLVLPYVDATQSALIAAAYFFRKPVIVTRTGALPEYVVEDMTGYVVEPDHPAGLARCLERMLSDPARLENMGTAGRIWYEARRRDEEAALLEVYVRVAESRSASR